jgi:hypothetical protein
MSTYPQNIKLNEYNNEAILTPKAAPGIGVTTNCENVDVKTIKLQINRNTRLDRSLTSSAGIFLLIPTG